MNKIEKTDNQNEVLFRIEELCHQYEWNHYRLAKASGIPLASLNSMFHRNTFPTIPTLEKICTGFRISLKEFFDYGNNISSPKLEPDAFSLLERYQELSRTDKKLLLSYLDGLQKRNSPSL